MAQHDYVIANGTGAAVRSDLNGGLAAIVSQNSGATAPSTTYAYQSWADTSAGVMKMRNGANNAWISLYELDGTFLAGDISLSGGAVATPSLFFTGDTNTGIYSPGADQVGISTGGTSRFEVSTTAVSSTLPVVHPLGAGGTPSLTFTGDPNTGIYSPGADQLAISTGGTGRVFVNAAGLVDISNTTSDKLTLSHPGFGIGTFGVDSTGSLLFKADEANTQASSVIQFKIDGGEKMRITSAGLVGIGTAPGGTVDIKAAASTAPLIVQGPSSEFARIDSSGRLLVGGSPDSGGALLQVFGDRIRIGTAKTPASASATGTAGEICWDASYIYVCTATNTWKRTAIATW